MYKSTIWLHLAIVISAANTRAEGLPSSVLKKTPPGYILLKYASGNLDSDSLRDYLVVMHKAEEANVQSPHYAAERPLLIFIQTSDGNFKLARRNDEVVFRLDEGAQCDPFLDGGYGGITIRYPYFTVENGVACGQHWTDYITFKYDPKLKDWLFHRRIYEVSFDPGNPNGKEKRTVHRGLIHRKIPFEKYSR